jgi:hypothetical protein
VIDSPRILAKLTRRKTHSPRNCLKCRRAGLFYQRVFAKIGKKFSDIASVVNLVIDITKTLSNDRLNVVQKIIKILGAAAAAITGTVIGGAVGLLFFNPVTAVLMAMLLVVLTTILIDLLVDWAVGQLAKLKRLIRRLEVEVEHA